MIFPCSLVEHSRRHKICRRSCRMSSRVAQKLNRLQVTGQHILQRNLILIEHNILLEITATFQLVMHQSKRVSNSEKNNAKYHTLYNADCGSTPTSVGARNLCVTTDIVAIVAR